jgi:hypothetical protein
MAPPFLTSELDVAALPPGKETPVPTGKGARWASEPVWTTWTGEKPYTCRASNSESLYRLS